MSYPSSEALTFGPQSTFLSSATPPQYGCHCHPMGSLEKLPLLHAVLDRTAGSFIGRVFTLVYQIAIALSVILLPMAILEGMVTILECIDCIGFLLVCCVEVLLPSLNRLFWGEVGHMPPACCDRSSAAFAPRSFSSGKASWTLRLNTTKLTNFHHCATRFIGRCSPVRPATSVHLQVTKLVFPRGGKEACSGVSTGKQKRA